jgi:cytochrome c biogenesis protein CcdA
VDTAILRSAVSIALVAFGAVLVVPALQAGFARISAPLAARGNKLLESMSPAGVWGQFLLGLLLGVVWSPCTGPTLGVAVGLAAQSDTIVFAAAVMTLFSFGTSTPVLALAYGSRKAIIGQRNSLAIVSRIAKPVMRIALIAVGALTFAGVNKAIETYLTDAMPIWLLELTTRF